MWPPTVATSTYVLANLQVFATRSVAFLRVVCTSYPGLVCIRRGRREAEITISLIIIITNGGTCRELARTKWEAGLVAY